MKVEAQPVIQSPNLNNEDRQVLINYWSVKKQNLLTESEDVKKFNEINEKLEALKSNGSLLPIPGRKIQDEEYPIHGSIISRVKYILSKTPDLTANEIATKIAEIEKLSNKNKKRIIQSCYAALNSGINSKVKQFTRKTVTEGSPYIYRVIG